MKLSNRGQTLVLFVLLLPVLLLILGFLIDIGNLHIQKRKVDYTVNDTLEYGMEHLDMDADSLKMELHKLLQLNLKNIEQEEITISGEEITILVTKKTENIFDFLFQEQNTITIRKKAYLVENQVRIIKER